MTEYVSIESAALLTGKSLRSIQRLVAQNKYSFRKIPSEKQAGKFKTEILITSLPVEAQKNLVLGMNENSNPVMVPSGTGKEFGSTNTQALASDELGGSPAAPSDALSWYHSLPEAHQQTVNHRREIVEGAPTGATGKELQEYCGRVNVKVRTFYDWQKKYKEHGLYGLRDSRYGQSRSKLTADQKNYIPALIKHNPDFNNVAIYDLVNDKFPKNPISGETVSRYIRKWKSDNHELFTFLTSPDLWKSRYQSAFGSQSEKAKYFLHYVEFDSTPADIMCADGKRYTIIGAVDIFSSNSYTEPGHSWAHEVFHRWLTSQ